MQPRAARPSTDVRNVPFYIPGEEDTRPEIDIPLKVRGELIGIFNVEHTEVDAFSPERIRLLEALAGHVATAIANARMFQRERLENARMAREFEEARAVQGSFLPPTAPAAQGFELAGVCRPCREVGGDWYDFIPLGDAGSPSCSAMSRVREWAQPCSRRRPAVS
ncbi:MAG TPA: GAF domain-containing protein [Vicinamibacterales bacterium]|nr:GAF domain-containing protein [Vicinamibacterales bacterium]